MRGVAAMVVVVQHALELVWPAWARFSLSWFRPGEFGVVLFFLCSGFIIPASLERHGSQSRFWIGRFFRLYPLYWCALAAALLLHYGFGRYPLEAGFLDHPVRSIAANATMAQDFLGVRLALGQSWSLAYELAFYGIVSALFVAGVHKRSAPLAFGGFVLTALPLAGRMPGVALAHPGPKLSLAIVAATVGAAAVVGWLARNAGRSRWLAVAIVVVVVPLVVNRPENFRTAALLFATLFTGTVLYRWTAGQTTALVTAIVLAAAFVAIVILGTTTEFDAPLGANLERAEITTYVGAYAVFVAALLARAATFPKALLYLGTISYSLYLNHSLAIYGIGWVGDSAAMTVVVWIAVSVGVSALTYRFIERPAIDAGRRYGASSASSMSSRWRARASSRSDQVRR